MKALIFENNDRIIELYKKILIEKNHTAEFVADVDSCLEKFGEQDDRYDLVVLEKPTTVSENDNLEDRIRTNRPDQKVFFLSPYMKPRDEKFRAFKETLDIIDKPFALISLLSHLEIRN